MRLPLLLLVPMALGAQAEGDRVRVTTADGATVTGRASGVDSASLTLTVSHRNTIAVVPRDAIATAFVSTGRDRAKGALRGTLVGLALGTWLAIDLARESDHRGDDPFALLQAVAIAVPVALTVGIGALTGFALAPERWQPVAVSPSPGAGRIALLFSQTDDVRITVAGRRHGGQVIAQSPTALSLRTDRSVETLPIADITRISVLGDRSRRRGAIRGAVIITAVTAVGIATDPLPSVGENIAVVAGNAAFGALIGAFFPMRKWTDLPVPAVSR